MTTPGGAIAPYPSGSPPSPPVLTPTAVASPKSSAVHDLGQVLKTMIHNSRAFYSENDVDNAVNTVDAFVGAFVPDAEMPALLTGAERAAKEDVTLRIPPGGVVTQVVTGPVIDYVKLAEAIVAVQRRQAAIDAAPPQSEGTTPSE